MLQLCFLVSNGLLLLIACAAAAVDEQACHLRLSHDNPWPFLLLLLLLAFSWCDMAIVQRPPYSAGQPTLHFRAAIVTPHSDDCST